MGGLIVWSFCGAIILLVAGGCSGGALGCSDGFEFVNPIHVYRYNQVNWFGAIVVAFFYAAICPIGAVCYWIYKLCTIGRK